jgi:hypothetical protein
MTGSFDDINQLVLCRVNSVSVTKDGIYITGTKFGKSFVFELFTDMAKGLISKEQLIDLEYEVEQLYDRAENIKLEIDKLKRRAK